jgi:hypothetical protein
MSAKLSFGFMGGIVIREGDPRFSDQVKEIMLGYCPACRRNKPGAYDKKSNQFLCLKCNYKLDESSIHRTSH